MNIKSVCQAVLLALLFTGPGWAQPAARVQALEGAKNLFIQTEAERNADPFRWFRAHLEMDANVKDHLKTDKDTLASLYFLLGGRANIDKGTEISIISTRNIDIIQIEKGTFWANFKKRSEEDKELRIRTAGGVMAIRGTEVVVEVGDSGSTQLSVVEGQVEVRPDQGDTIWAGEGSVVTLDPNLRGFIRYVDDLQDRLRAEHPQLSELREEILEVAKVGQDIRDFQYQVGAGETAHNYNNRRFTYLETGRDIGAGGNSVDTTSTDRKLAELDALLAGTKAQPESEGSDNGESDAELLRALLNGRGASAAGPEYGEPLSGYPKLEWDWLPGKRFAILVLPENGQDLLWLARTNEKTYQYPQDARALPPGNYRYRVLVLGPDDKPVGKAVEAKFVVAP